MSTRAARRLGFSALGFSVFSLVTAFAVSWATGAGADPVGLTLLSFPTVGALIVSRQPRNAVGWIMLAVGVSEGLDGGFQLYARYALEVERGSLPGADLALALSAPTWVPLIALPGTFLLLLFPDGRLPSPRWRGWARLCAAVIALAFVFILVGPGSFADQGYPGIRNPLGIDALQPVAAAVFGVVALIPICIVGCAVALVRRFRRSHGQARLQVKWLALGGGVTAALYLVAMVPSIALSSGWEGGRGTPVWLTVLQTLALASFVLVLPVSIGIAMFRYRLYDIDVVINRALVYGVLTALLGGAYLGSILLLGLALSPLTESSDLAIAASTLAVAALFRPARARVQAVVDRRFYRRRYDAARTLEGFGARLRDQVDLDALGGELRTVVDRTVAPAQVSLWLRPARRGGAGGRNVGPQKND